VLLHLVGLGVAARGLLGAGGLPGIAMGAFASAPPAFHPAPDARSPRLHRPGSRTGGACHPTRPSGWRTASSPQSDDPHPFDPPFLLHEDVAGIADCDLGDPPTTLVNPSLKASEHRPDRAAEGGCHRLGRVAFEFRLKARFPVARTASYSIEHTFANPSRRGSFDESCLVKSVDDPLTTGV
jgi:hypothetical protein